MPNWSVPVANLILSGARWTDEHGSSPPSYWNGTEFEFLDPSDSGVVHPRLTATANAGDIVSFVLDVTVPGNAGSAPNVAQLTVNGSTVWTQDIGIIGSFTFNSGPLSASDAVEFEMFSHDGPVYRIEAVMSSPLPAAPKTGFVLATGDDVSPSSGLGTLTTLFAPLDAGDLAFEASYVRTPQGMAAVFYGFSPVLTMQLPEDVGEAAYVNTPKQKFTWRSKKFVFPGMTTFGAAKVVHSCQGGGVKFRLFVDCCCVYQTVVRGCVPFRLPAQLRGITAEIELSGCSRVTEVRLASSIRELMGDE